MKERILGILSIVILIIFAMTMSVYALSFTATMTPSGTTIEESTEFTVTVKVSNLDVGTNGINSLTGFLKYDTDIFETISDSSIEGLNSWTPTFEASTGKISLTKNTFVTSTQEVFQITFKTKSGVSGKSGTIEYSNIVASNSESDISATSISTSISVGTSNGSNNENNTNSISNISVISANTVGSGTNNSTTNTNVVNNATNITSYNTTNNATNNVTNNTVSSYVNTTSDTDMPKTGVDDTILMLVFISIAVAIGFYIKIEKLNNDMK